MYNFGLPKSSWGASEMDLPTTAILGKLFGMFEEVLGSYLALRYSPSPSHRAFGHYNFAAN